MYNKSKSFLNLDLEYMFFATEITVGKNSPLYSVIKKNNNKFVCHLTRGSLQSLQEVY